MARLHVLAICDILKGTEKRLAFLSWLLVPYPPVSLHHSLKQSTSPGKTRKRLPCSFPGSHILVAVILCGGINDPFPNTYGVQDCGEMRQWGRR